MFVSPAFAQAGGAGAGPGAFEAMLPLILIFVVFYFLLIRPQQKKMKQHKEMLGTIRRGDRVVTGGGIVGTVTKVVDDTEVLVEIAPDLKVRVQRALISSVMAKTEPVKDAPKGKGDGGAKEGAKEGGAMEGAAAGLRKLLGGKEK
jgi:preprotein translocase subunit YajC